MIRSIGQNRTHGGFKWHLAVAGVLMCAAGSAQATNGYFPHGFGIKAKGMGGVAIALDHDAFGGVNNPASSAMGSSRLDVGAEWFRPKRDAQFIGVTPVIDSGRQDFLIPEFGYVARVNDKLAWGVTVYGNGGMNTSYPAFGNGSNLLNPMPGAGKLGVDLMQLIVAPHLAWNFAPGHALGVAPLLVVQRFEAYGLQSFAGFSVQPQALTNRGKDSSTGIGVRLGYRGQLTPQFAIGASFSPKTRMSRFDKYAGLFADGGNFNIPANWGLGVSFKPTPALTLALDYQRIDYSGVDSIGHASLARLFAGQPLGASTGPGFGWRDIDVVKLGVQWQINPQWAVRAGINNGSNPVPSADAMFNILAPGVTRRHITVGLSFAPDRQQEWSAALWHAGRENVIGPSVNFMTNQVNPNGTRIGMSQMGLGVQFSRKF